MNLQKALFSARMFSWARKPLSAAFLTALLLAAIIMPYWWLAVQWSSQVIFVSSVRFTFATTTFLLALIIIDSLFIIRYYQIRRRDELTEQTLELKKSEENLRLLLEHAPFPIVISRVSDSTVRFVNREAANLFSVDPSRGIGNHVQDYYVYPEDRARILDLLKRDGHLRNYEIQLFSSTRNVFWASLSAASIRYLGDPCLFIAFIDISRRKQLEEVIQRSEELYRSVVAASPDAIVFSDLTGIMTMVSPAAVQMFGGNSEYDFIDHHVLEFIHPDDALRAKQMMRSLLSGEKLQLHEYRGQRTDNSYFPYEIHSELTHDDAGNPSGIVYVIRDITKRKETEQALVENEERFATVFQEVPDPLLILAKSGEILELNATAESRLQVTRDGVIGRHISDLGLFRESSETNPNLFILGEHSGEILDARMHLPDGSWRYVTIKTRFIVLRGSPAILLLIHDIDDSRRAQDAVTQANTQLSLLNSITRHDILNRVTVVMSYSEFLKDMVTDPASLLYINRINESGADIQHLIEFTRQYQDLGVREPVWQQIDTIAASQPIQGLLRGITVHLPPLRYEIFADPMLEKVMYNLIENSRRHGQSVTHITLSYQEDEGGLLVIYEDNGAGIPDSEKPLIFKKGHGKNTGLGLFLIREVLHITGISILENGTPGAGARFEMRVPAGVFRALTDT